VQPILIATRCRAEVAKIFGVSLPSIKRWLKRRPETGKVDPKPIPGPLHIKGAMLEEWLRSHLRSNPDLTLEEHCKAFEEQLEMKVSTATMSRSISRLPRVWPIKKVPSSLRARRGSQRTLEVAGQPLRCQTPCVHRRERAPHLHDALEGLGSERREGLRQGPKEPRQEHYADRLDHL
jgi:transposase